MIEINTTGIETDIDLAFAQRAYYNISFSPEKRGQTEVSGYIAAMQDLAAFIADNTDNQELGQQVFDKIREGYKKRTIAHLSAKSRCISSMITGPANFPVRRAEKANTAEHKRLGEFLDYHNGMKKYALKILKPVDRRKTDKENVTHKFKGFEVVENHDEDRLQLIFNGKPDESTRTMLKSNGFKWSPRFGAWQRQFTDNASRAFNRIKDALEAAA